MAIHSSAMMANIMASLNLYVQTKWQGTGGIPTNFLAANIWYQGEQYDTGAVSYFLRPTLRRGAAEYFSRVNNTNPGSIVYYSWFLDVFVLREYVRQKNSLYLLEKTLDMLRDSIKGSDTITVKNYDGNGATDLGLLRVRNLQPNQPVDDLWLSGGWLVSLQWIEQDATA
jgi:hypothetical protein